MGANKHREEAKLILEELLVRYLDGCDDGGLEDGEGSECGECGGENVSHDGSPNSDDFDIGTRLDGLTNKMLGALGEELAAWYLTERGYEIVERNYRCPEGEADIVALDCESDEIVLIEVKTRRCRRGCGEQFPEEAVTPRKRTRYRRIAHCFVADNYPAPAIRFDVIAVTIDTDPCARKGTIHHICRAFDWEACS